MGNVSGRDEVDYGDDDDVSVRSRSDADPGSTHYLRNGSVGSIEMWPPDSPSLSRSPLMFAPQVPRGKCIKKGQILADGVATVGGGLSLGKNVLVAYMPWEGYNYEDAVLISERLVYEDIYPSFHIRKYEIQTHVTSQGPERITKEIPHLEAHLLRNLDRNGVVMHIPVPPLRANADAPLMFNQQWMNEQQLDGPLEKGIPTVITWNRGGHSVLVEGSWDNWTSRKTLQRSSKDHATLMVLPSGVYHYRFIVDGQIRCIPDLPFVTDEAGNITNLLDVHDYVPESVESISEFDYPPSPDSSYSWPLPADEDFAKEPPILPPQMHLTVLGMQHTDAALKPQHVELNHLFIEKGPSSQPTVALGMTHRCQSKYVTVVLYKPAGR